MYLTSHETSHDYLIDGSCKFMVGSSLRYVTVISLMTISTGTVET